MKILSPAGNFESLKMAIFNGADEVYLGINDFNARNNINGFNIDNLGEAVDFAHIFAVKVNLAINILFSNSELQSALDTLIKAYNLGVDCFIVQDLALAKLVSENYPEIELHASTQMGICNLEGVKAIEPFGFKRVVLARETPLAEIKRIKENSNIEIEYFAHGALCVAFSGNCYLSSYLHGASGNRGKCKQLCRLPYSLLKNGKVLKTGYLLSAKDFNTINRLKELEAAGVTALKIEGRARRPFYVATATREYYNALHNIKANETNLKLAFNRDYTAGYFDGNGNIISNHNNHIGIEIGKVLRVNNGKRFNEVFISSNRELTEKSTFKFYTNEKETNTISAFDLTKVKQNEYRLTTTQKVNPNSTVNLILDFKQEETVLSEQKRQPLLIDLFAETNKPIKAIITINNNKTEVLGEVLQPAIKQPLTEANFNENFNKSELFEAKLNIKQLEPVFMPKQQLNDFRRKVFEVAVNNLTKPYKRNLNTIMVNTNKEVIPFVDFEFVENINEKFNSKNIVYSPEEYSLEDVKKFIKKCKAENKTPILDTPNFAVYEDIKQLENIINETNITIVANNYYALTFNTNIIIGGGLNVYNNITGNHYNKPIIVSEGGVATKRNFPYMTLRHCPFKNHLKANCSNCPYSNDYSLKMEWGKELKIKRKKLSSCTFYLTD